jgi:uncharacterized repeat protein (TIGR01451 family)
MAMDSISTAYGNRFRPTGLLGAVLCGMPALGMSVTLQKAFDPTTIVPGDTTELRFTVTNPAGSMSRSDLGIVDTLPSGLRVANPPSVSGTCANAAAATIATGGTGTISISSLQVPAGTGGDATCTVTVRITNASGQYNFGCGPQPAAFTNGPGNVSVTNLTNEVSPSCLIVSDRLFADGFE